MAEFHRIQSVHAAGYDLVIGLDHYFDNPSVGGMGYHNIDAGILDLTVDELQPEAMVYIYGPNDGRQLGSVEYIVPAEACDAAGNTEPPTALGQSFHLNPTLGVYVLHAWIWSDLFWAVRGGGGNFGVVTSFHFRGVPVSTVYGGPIFWPMEHASKVMRFWRDLILNGSEDLNGWFGFHTVPPVDMFSKEYHLQKMAIIVWCYTGDLNKAEDVFKPIRNVASPAMDFVGPIPLPALQSMFDWMYPPGLQWYWNANFFRDINDEVIELNVQHARQLPTLHSAMHIYPINGAAHRVGKKESAWGYRDANFSQVIAAVDPDPANNKRMIQWSKDYWQAMYPYSAGGGYVNMIMDEGTERVKAAYGDNYPRLAAVKQKYDPTNLFSVNQNIRPDAKNLTEGTPSYARG